MPVSLGQALAWRLDRQFLVTGEACAADVVRRLGGIPTWSGDADLAVRRRLSDPAPDAVARAVADGDLVRTYAFRGATYLLAADDAGAYLAVRAASRQWELRSWREHYRLEASDWPALRAAVREALADGPLTRPELADAVAAHARFSHLREALADRSHTLNKPLAWQGDLVIGPSQDGQMTYQSPTASPRWQAPPDLADAGRYAVLAYLAGYGPATRANLHHWLVEGLSAGQRRLEGWLMGLLDDGAVVGVEVDGEPMLVRAADRDSLAAQPETAAVTLLPGLDAWVLGPGTDDARVVPPLRRAAVTRGAALVLRSGVVVGAWKVAGGTLAVSWFREAGVPPVRALEAEGHRLAGLLGRELDVTVSAAKG
ncbi:DNA glycosylase AlkZ-like family protein [Georgenia faecalis]|uniref:DNA glycosylase AlkZ-like family protein n=1 Tax=Georgenia faecalis TaxID=2483799 RepID=UPI000FD8F650|nr:crosslink repair DNA glycosylase YcaQ family protein [Georgenia faecalis]